MKKYLALLLTVTSCSTNPQDVDYTKGYPFWKHSWNNGELMATYYSADEWKYLKYFEMPDTLVSPSGEMIADNDSRIGIVAYRGKFNGASITFYDYSKVVIDGNIVEFPAIARER